MSVALIVAWSLIAVQAVEWIADALNVKALKRRPPEGFDGIYEPEKYARSQDYTRTKTRFGFVSSFVKLGCLLMFWKAGGFGFVDRWARSLAEGEVGSGLLFFLALYLLNEVLETPFSVYGTFVLEERFGFNRTKPGTYIADRLKGFLLTTVIGGPLAAVLLWLFREGGPRAWLWAWGTMGGWALFLQFIAPTWILPLFNKFTPVPEGDLRKAVFSYAEKVGFPLKNLFVMDGSKRSAKGNAFFTGFGKNKRIALFDTLVEKQSVQELVAVLAHEIGHYKKGHVWRGMILSQIQTGAMLYVFSWILGWKPMFDAFHVAPSVHAGVAVFGIILSPVAFLMAIPLKYLSRRREYEADRYALDTLGNGHDLANGLKKLSSDSLSNLTPHGFYVFLHYTHPPLVQRVQALEGGT